MPKYDWTTLADERIGLILLCLCSVEDGAGDAAEKRRGKNIL